jgi:hypothetical protein
MNFLTRSSRDRAVSNLISVTKQWAREYWRGILSISALVKARNVCVRILPRMSAEQQYAGRRLIIRSKKTQIWSYWPSVQYIAHEGARSFHSGVAGPRFPRRCERSHHRCFFTNARPECDLKYFSSSAARFSSDMAMYVLSVYGFHLDVCGTRPSL